MYKTNLVSFCKRLGNSNLLIDSSLAYEIFKLKSYSENLKIDILKELTKSSVNKNNFLDYVIYEIELIFIEETDPILIEDWLNEYNTTIGDILYEKINNKHFKHIINMNYNQAKKNVEIDLVFVIQNQFYLYFSRYFANELSVFLKSKKEKSPIQSISYQTSENMKEKEAEKIKWSGKKTHIGYIFGNLALKGYIDAPKHKNGEINFTAYAKIIKQNFDVDVDLDTLRKYLNPADEKYEENRKSFEFAKFNLPNIIEVS